MSTNALRCYKNNQNLKGLGVKLEMSREQLSEYIKCSNDPIYFIKKYVKIVHIDFGTIPFKMRDYQEEMVETFNDNRFVLCKLARQAGKSTTVVAYILWFILFHPDKNVAILANKQSLAIEILDRLKFAYELLPWFLQQGVATWNKTKIEVENGSKIMAAATSSSSVRGNSFSLIFLDEFAHIRPKLAEEFFASVYPTISSGQKSKVIIVSTPNGMNHFYKLWEDAERGKNSYKTISVNWRRIPNRTEAWRLQEIANTSERQFAQEQDCEFLGSSGTLITPAKLLALTAHDPIHRQQTIHTNDYFDIIIPKKKDHSYVLVADVAEGVGMDYSAFSVFDITEIPYVQVAKYRSNRIPETLYPDVIEPSARYYNDAMVLIENNTGREVANVLELELGYENLISVIKNERDGQAMSGGFGNSNTQSGVRMTKQVKRLGCSTLKTLIESDKLQVHDADTIQELLTFVQTGKSYAAEVGFHDDLVMTLVIFAWLSTQSYFKDYTNLDVRRKILENRAKEVEEEALSFFFSNTSSIQHSEIESISGDYIWTMVDKYGRR